MNTLSLIGYNIFISVAAFAVFLIAYAFRQAENFQIGIWIRQNGARLGMGSALLILISGLMEVSPEFDLILTAIGFNTNASPVALGLAVGAMAVGVMSASKRLDE